jgi:hypothetical protein
VRTVEDEVDVDTAVEHPVDDPELYEVRTAGEQLEQERAGRLRQAADYDDILDMLTARNDTLRAAIDRFKAAAHLATARAAAAEARAASAEAELAAVRGRGADMAPPVALAPSPPPAATATERALRAIATSDEDFLTDADMLIAAGAPQAGGAVLLQPDRPARGEGAAAGSPAAESPSVPTAPPARSPPPGPQPRPPPGPPLSPPPSPPPSPPRWQREPPQGTLRSTAAGSRLNHWRQSRGRCC